MDLKDKKVLLMGLGILGGGVATARFLAEQGARLTVTDMKDKDFLAQSLQKLSDLKINYVLGEHREEDFLNTDILVINPDVSINNKFVKLAKDAGKQIENELTLFYNFCPSKNIVAVTGTRGKTTTASWIYHFLKQKYKNSVLIGNSPDKPFLKDIQNIEPDALVVLEVPSYHLELENNIFKPHVAVITNIYQDHLNRHSTLEEYARVKANIFRNQTEENFLILNKENKWTDLLLSLKPRSKVLFFSPDTEKPNLASAVLAAKTIGVEESVIESAISSLPQIKFRQEKVFENDSLTIYNDTTATSPEGAIAAFDRFPKAIFIVGGTDRELDFTAWGEVVKSKIPLDSLIMLSGSATEKMKAQLGWEKYNEFDTLEECFKAAIARAASLPRSCIVFSPGAKSFEKFKNEFDRGEKFNDLVVKLTK